tara:strand:+ start:3663 stop:4535 length:873 start_codon:yes stop_codon:yes gene_type:complete
MKKFNNFSKKFVLGTAQLCEKYGYFNKSKSSNKKAIKILETAYENNIFYYDTAPAYGSENLIGAFIKANNLSQKIKVSSKIPSLQKESNPLKSVSSYLTKSSKSLNYCIDNIFFHDPKDFRIYLNNKTFFNDIFNDLNIKNFGLSVYSNADINKISKYNKKITIQFPYNILDRNFEKYNKKFKIKFARSILLQGLLAYNASIKKINNNLFKNFLIQYHKLLNKYKLNPYDVAVSFVLQNKHIDFFIIGIDNIDQLTQLINFKEYKKKLIQNIINHKFEFNKKLIDPRQWN